jgi:hypothetical protein
MSPNLPTLQALLARVEGGEGEDRALDAEIALHIGGCVRYRNWYDDDAKTQHAWHCKWQADCEWEPLPHFVTSLDAAVALVERRLPGFVLDVEGHAGSAHWSAIIGDHGAIGLTPARALIAALLWAEIAKAQEPQP